MIIVGAGGHALEILDVILEKEISEDLYFFDDVSEKLSFPLTYPVLRSLEEVKRLFPSKFDFVLGIGNPKYRLDLYTKFAELGGIYKPVISMMAFISNSVYEIKFDTLKNTFIGASASIGEGALINTGAQVHHGSTIGKFTEVSPMALILGNCKVGSLCSIGSNATVLSNISIVDNAVIGAGAVVTRNIQDPGTYVGIPAKKI